MICKYTNRRCLSLAAAALCALLFFGCDETLPVHTFPDKVLSMEVTIAEQLPDHIAIPGRQMVHVRLTGENTYTDVFQDQVDVRGTMTVWWKRLPRYYRTIALTEHTMSDPEKIHGGRMTLLPGEKFSMDIYWNLKGDDSLYFPNRMDFSRVGQRICAPNVVCGTTETFVIESSVQIFTRLGVIAVPASEFQFVPRACPDLGYPPCSLPVGPGGG